MLTPRICTAELLLQTCYSFTMLYFAVVPGNLPSQLEICSMGQPYYQGYYSSLQYFVMTAI